MWLITKPEGMATFVDKTMLDDGTGLYSATFTVPAEVDGITKFAVYAYPSSVAGASFIEWIKLEKGNKATDWSPAPEDIDADIDTKQDILSSANAGDGIEISPGGDGKPVISAKGGGDSKWFTNVADKSVTLYEDGDIRIYATTKTSYPNHGTALYLVSKTAKSVYVSGRYVRYLAGMAQVFSNNVAGSTSGNTPLEVLSPPTEGIDYSRTLFTATTSAGKIGFVIECVHNYGNSFVTITATPVQS